MTPEEKYLNDLLSKHLENNWKVQPDDARMPSVRQQSILEKGALENPPSPNFLDEEAKLKQLEYEDIFDNNKIRKADLQAKFKDKLDKLNQFKETQQNVRNLPEPNVTSIPKEGGVSRWDRMLSFKNRANAAKTARVASDYTPATKELGSALGTFNKTSGTVNALKGAAKIGGKVLGGAALLTPALEGYEKDTETQELLKQLEPSDLASFEEKTKEPFATASPGYGAPSYGKSDRDLDILKSFVKQRNDEKQKAQEFEQQTINEQNLGKSADSLGKFTSYITGKKEYEPAVPVSEPELESEVDVNAVSDENVKPVQWNSDKEIDTSVDYWSKELNIDPSLIRNLIMKESSGNRQAMGDGGKAYGLTQMHERTARDLGFSDKENLMDVHTNVGYAAKLLRKNYDTISQAAPEASEYDKWKMAASGYNQGLGYYTNVIDYLKQNNQPITWKNVENTINTISFNDKQPLRNAVKDYGSFIMGEKSLERLKDESGREVGTKGVVKASPVLSDLQDREADKELLAIDGNVPAEVSEVQPQISDEELQKHLDILRGSIAPEEEQNSIKPVVARVMQDAGLAKPTINVPAKDLTEAAAANINLGTALEEQKGMPLDAQVTQSKDVQGLVEGVDERGIPYSLDESGNKVYYDKEGRPNNATGVLGGFNPATTPSVDNRVIGDSDSKLQAYKDLQAQPDLETKMLMDAQRQSANQQLMAGLAQGADTFANALAGTKANPQTVEYWKQMQEKSNAPIERFKELKVLRDAATKKQEEKVAGDRFRGVLESENPELVGKLGGFTFDQMKEIAKIIEDKKSKEAVERRHQENLQDKKDRTATSEKRLDNTVAGKIAKRFEVKNDPESRQALKQIRMVNNLDSMINALIPKDKNGVQDWRKLDPDKLLAALDQLPDVAKREAAMVVANTLSGGTNTAVHNIDELDKIYGYQTATHWMNYLTSGRKNGKLFGAGAGPQIYNSLKTMTKERDSALANLDNAMENALATSSTELENPDYKQFVIDTANNSPMVSDALLDKWGIRKSERQGGGLHKRGQSKQPATGLQTASRKSFDEAVVKLKAKGMSEAAAKSALLKRYKIEE